MKPKFLSVVILCVLSASSTWAKDFLIWGENTRVVTYMKRPEYPYIARREKITGSGVVRMKVNKAGLVESVEMGQSTGSSILDQAALLACKQWRFKPGSVIGWARLPVTFTMPWAQFPPQRRR